MKQVKAAVLLLFIAALFTAPAHAQSFVSGSCQEEGSGGSPNNFPVTANAGDTIVVQSLDYIGNATITNATWNSGTHVATLTVTSNSQTSGQFMVYGVNPSGWNGVHTMTAETSTSISYSTATNPGTYVSGGSASGEVQSITDNSTGGPNTYSEISGSAIANAGGMVTQWAAANVKAGSYTVSVNYGPGDQFNASCVLDFTGMPSTLQVDHVAVGLTGGLNTLMTTPSAWGDFTHEVFLVSTGTQNAVWEGTLRCGTTPALTNAPDGNGIGGSPAGYLADTGNAQANFCADFRLDIAEAGDTTSIVLLKSNNSDPGTVGGSGGWGIW